MMVSISISKSGWQSPGQTVGEGEGPGDIELGGSNTEMMATETEA